jgi:hypothetical protein
MNADRTVFFIGVAEAEFSEELALCPPVSIAKGMNGIDLAKVIGASNGGGFEATAGEIPFTLQFSTHVVEARNNVLVECEGIAGFRDIHGTELSRPFVHVLKDVLVDRLEMPRIEPARYRLVFQFNGPPGCRYRLKLAEPAGVTNIPQVPKNIRSGGDVRVHIGESSLASLRRSTVAVDLATDFAPRTRESSRRNDLPHAPARRPESQQPNANSRELIADPIADTLRPALQCYNSKSAAHDGAGDR